jgi:hypothetical protein
VPHSKLDAALKSSGSPSDSPTKSDGIFTTRDIDKPITSAGTATTNPAIGPAMPMSNSMCLVGIASRIRMNAPSVPVSGRGAGRKNGSDASTS